MKGHNDKDDPALGEKPMFSHFYLRQMRAEELYESLLVATDADKAHGSLEEQEQAEDRMAAAVHHGVRDRRRRRHHDVQRHDSADVDDVQRRND